MHFKHPLTGAIALLCLIKYGLAGMCDEGPFTYTAYPFHPPSTEECHDICDTKWEQGLMVITVYLWTANNQTDFRGFQFLYSDFNLGELIGTTDGELDEVDVTPTGNLLNRKQRNADGHGESKMQRDISVPRVEVGVSGFGASSETERRILLGARGRCENGVLGIELMHIASKAVKAEVIDIQFQQDLATWNKQKLGIQPGIELVTTVENPNSSNGSSRYFDFDFTTSQSASASRLVDQNYSTVFEVPVTFGTGVMVPIFTDNEYRLEGIKPTGRDSSMRSLNVSMSGVVAPGYAMECCANVQTGVFDSAYMSTVEISMVDGGNFTVVQPGLYSSFGSSITDSTCRTIPLDKAPLDAIEADDM